MKFGIIGAMDEEIEHLKELLINREDQRIDQITYYLGNIGSHDVVMVKSGIGKVTASITVMQLHHHYNVDVIINTGSAGGLDSTLNIGDVVIANELRYHDVDVTNFGYEIGQMAGMPVAYTPTEEWIKKCQTSVQELDINCYSGLIVSGDQFINDNQKLLKIKGKFPHVFACEMESTAIAQTCYHIGLPYLIIRAISDNANHEATITFDEFIKLAGKQAAQIVYQTINEAE